MYRTFREKEVASAARALIALFRQVAPAMLEKRDRGRGADTSQAPLAYGSARIVARIPGAELLQAELAAPAEEPGQSGSEAASISGGSHGNVACDVDEVGASSCSGGSTAGGSLLDPQGGLSDDDAGLLSSDDDSHSIHAARQSLNGGDDLIEDSCEIAHCAEESVKLGATRAAAPPRAAPGPQQRHAGDPAAHLPASADQGKAPDSLRALKQQLAAGCSRKRPSVEMGNASEVQEPQLEVAAPLEYGRFLTVEDFSRIRELRQQQLVDAAMAKHGLKSAAKRARLLAAAQDDAEEALEALASPNQIQPPPNAVLKALMP